MSRTVSRRYDYYPVCGSCFSGVLLVHVEHKGEFDTEVYAVEETETAHLSAIDLPPLAPCPRFFAVAKCGEPQDMTDTQSGLYLVRVSQGAGIKDECECFGYNRWQHCKHISALAYLIQKGKL